MRFRFKVNETDCSKPRCLVNRKFCLIVVRRMATLLPGCRRTPRRRFLTVSIAFLVLIGYVSPIRHADAAEDARLIEPGLRVGPITARTREADLVRLLGHANVRREDLDIGEGDKRPGTVLFPRGKDELWLFWKEDAYDVPEHVVITGERTAWRTAEGITMGTTIDTLVRLNGRHFKLHGFAWDYSGTVTSWEGGRLDRFGDNLIVRIGPTIELDSLAPKELDSVLGEQVISSATPALKRLGVTDYELVVRFEAHPK